MRRRILLVACAVLLALVGTFAVYSYAQGANRRALDGTRAASALVVTKRVPAGISWAAVVKGRYATRQSLPASSVPSDAVTDVRAAAIGSDAVAQSDIAPGQVVLRESFGTPTAQTGALSIPRGEVAVSLSLTSDADVAGYVAPQSQIVVFHTFTMTGGRTTNATGADSPTTQGQGLTVTRTLIPRASVLATSQAAPTTVSGASATQDASTSGGSVLLTLALSQRDAQRLVLAQKTGSLYVGLLSASSKVSGGDAGVDNIGELSPAEMYGTTR